MEIIESYLESLNYTGDLRYIIFGIDVVLVLGLFLILTIILYKKLKRKIVWLVSIAYFVVFVVTVILQLELVKLALIASLAVVCVSSLALASYEHKYGTRNYNTPVVKTTKNFVTDQNAKNAVIDALVTTAEYFSSRKIGAIITIEKENNLNVYIEKAIKLDAELSCELLKTIFFPNTALHDGAVIIRGNRVMCAAAYYNLSDKPDIQNELGTRHRAAIGISEDSDAFTLVVSEETGQISTTIDGTITRGVSEAALRLSLDQHIIVQ